MKLFLKGTRCDSQKCAIERRDAPPGMIHGRRAKLTDYAIHLREKQKVKHYYGVLERQFRTYFEHAEHSKVNTGDALMSMLERRLDNVVYRLGFGLSRAQARQLINHGHVTVNNHRCDISSYLCKPGDVIRIKSRGKSITAVKGNLEQHSRQVPDFLSRIEDGDVPEGQMTRFPDAEDVSIPVETQLIIELCSR